MSVYRPKYRHLFCEPLVSFGHNNEFFMAELDGILCIVYCELCMIATAKSDLGHFNMAHIRTKTR